jgi:hypothetical protein
MKAAKDAAPIIIGARTLAEVQGAETPPEVTPMRNKTDAEIKVKRPR